LRARWVGLRITSDVHTIDWMCRCRFGLSCAAVSRASLASKERDATPSLGARGEATRARIIAAAAQLFLENGFDATSVNAIARAAKVSVPALYWHFESKTDICFSFLELYMGAFAEAMLSESDQGTPDERLRHFVRTYVRASIADQEGSNAYVKLYTFGQLSTVLDDEHRERLVSLERGVLERLRAILRDGKAAGTFAIADVKVAAFAIVGACEYTFQWYRHEGPLSVDQVADDYAQMMEALARAGISAPGAPPRPLRATRVRQSTRHSAD
jgi:TetR/AcrR family transcriptional regulator, cholesterol catabolism regulator